MVLQTDKSSEANMPLLGSHLPYRVRHLSTVLLDNALNLNRDGNFWTIFVAPVTRSSPGRAILWYCHRPEEPLSHLKVVSHTS